MGGKFGCYHPGGGWRKCKWQKHNRRRYRQNYRGKKNRHIIRRKCRTIAALFRVACAGELSRRKTRRETWHFIRRGEWQWCGIGWFYAARRRFEYRANVARRFARFGFVSMRAGRFCRTNFIVAGVGASGICYCIPNRRAKNPSFYFSRN